MKRRPHLIVGAVAIAILAFGSVGLAQEATPSPGAEALMSPAASTSPATDECPTPPVMASPEAMASLGAIPSLDGNGSSSLELCPSPAPSPGAIESSMPAASPFASMAAG